MTDNWWLETIASAITQDASGNGTLAVSGGGSGGGAATIADGADVAEGATTDAATAAGATGSVSAKLRAISRDLTNGTQQIQGNVASAATDSGNPIKVGAKYNSTAPTFTDGQRADLQSNNKGDLRVLPVALYGANYNGLNMVGNIGDATNGASVLATAGFVWNGSTYDRQRGSTTAGTLVNITAAPTVSTVSVATTSTTVLAANTARKKLILTNVGVNAIYLNMAGGTAVNTNIQLASGQTLIDDTWVSQTAITAIATSAATNLSVTEYV